MSSCYYQAFRFSEANIGVLSTAIRQFLNGNITVVNLNAAFANSLLTSPTVNYATVVHQQFAPVNPPPNMGQPFMGSFSVDNSSLDTRIVYFWDQVPDGNEDFIG
jgi:hypothetical protein